MISRLSVLIHSRWLQIVAVWCGLPGDNYHARDDAVVCGVVKGAGGVVYMIYPV